MVNNFEIIKPLLKFDDPDKFYFLQIIQRKKENPNAPSNNKVVKNYFFNNMEYIERKWDTITGLCEFFNARAMLRLNRRSYRTIAHKMLIKLADCMEQGNWEHIRNQYQKVCGNHHSESPKTWVVDIDEKLEKKELSYLKHCIDGCSPVGLKQVATIPSINGTHLITTPFNIKEFRDNFEDYKDIEVHKDNPTNLYIP